MTEHLHLLNFAGAGRVTPFIMNCAVILILTSSCLTWSSAIYIPNRAAPKKLKYLLEPPVYAEVIGRRGGNVTLPCILRTKPSHYKVKWTKLEPERAGPENIIMISNCTRLEAVRPPWTAGFAPECSRHGRFPAAQPA
ncbi:Hyaluronan and proteoglycan link protein 2 [Larimichthys crocea]|uniref:Uncharacterized protein n=1 Tax=Larimichthys crocea TaxID=215358 RepID=A0ACD3QWQ0_LARCR|nr:Hyaluronan and proteoglycan link protein 2 [Larimichthys crocea]